MPGFRRCGHLTTVTHKDGSVWDTACGMPTREWYCEDHAHLYDPITLKPKDEANDH